MNVVIGTGIDLVENSRISQMINRWGTRFIDRVFCKSEAAYCMKKAFPHHHFAGRFAVKEAVSKALRTGINAQVGWLNIEIVRHPESGAPSVILHGTADRYARSIGVSRILISLSHTQHYAIASATLLAEQEGA